MSKSYLLDPDRLNTLRRLQILDTGVEEGFERLTQLAKRLVGTPVALLSLVDDKRQFFKSAPGLTGPYGAARETPLSHSFCQYVVTRQAPLSVEDARNHELVSENLAIEDLGVESYLGFPVTAPDGHVLGSFCVLDTNPREWTSEEEGILRELSLQIDQAIMLRHEIQERVRAEEDLLDLLEKSPAGICCLALDGRLLWANQSLTDLIGSRTEKPINWFKDPDFLRAHFDQVLAKDGVVSVETVLANGARVLLHSNLRKEQNEHVLRMFCVDVTEQRTVESAKRDLEVKMLENQRLESLGRIAGGIAHDFNNVLTVVTANVGIAQTLTTPEQGELIKTLSEIESATEQAASVVGQMLTYTGKNSTEMQSTDLNEVIRSIVRTLGATLTQVADVQICLGPIPAVLGNPVQLGQVVMNLLINAAEALETGGRIRVTTSYDEQVKPPIRLEVFDNGCGIDEEIRNRIFDPFFSTKSKGKGLGLASVLGIVRAHSGELQVDSERGEGTNFRISLPRVQEVPQSSGAKPTILLVDDEEAVRRPIARMLERTGFQVEMAENGQVAVDKFWLAPSRYQLVLMDLTMPVMNGIDAMTMILEKAPAMKVLLMSGYCEEQLPRGQAGFLKKPFSMKTLISKVRTVLAAPLPQKKVAN